MTRLVAPQVFLARLQKTHSTAFIEYQQLSENKDPTRADLLLYSLSLHEAIGIWKSLTSTNYGKLSAKESYQRLWIFLHRQLKLDISEPERKAFEHVISMVREVGMEEKDLTI